MLTFDGSIDIKWIARNIQLWCAALDLVVDDVQGGLLSGHEPKEHLPAMEPEDYGGDRIRSFPKEMSVFDRFAHFLAQILNIPLP